MLPYSNKILFSIIKILFLFLLFFSSCLFSFFVSLNVLLQRKPNTRDQDPSSKPTWPCSCDCKISRAWMSFEGDPKRCFILRSPKGWVFRPRANPIHRVPSQQQRGAHGELGSDWKMGQDRLEGRQGCIRVPWTQRRVVLGEPAGHRGWGHGRSEPARVGQHVRGCRWHTKAASHSHWDQAEGGAPRWEGGPCRASWPGQYLLLKTWLTLKYLVCCSFGGERQRKRSER